MEDLTKHQLILLTLLVSFVTSIATGIITYTLLQEAPVEVTQTINRVVEKTIERVVPEEGSKGETIKEVTTVVSEEDLVLDSIDKNSKSIVRLKTFGFDGSEIFSGIGIVVSETGVIVVDSSSFTSGNYSATFYDGTSYNISKSYKDPNSGFTFLKIGKAASDSYKFYPVSFGNPNSLRLGQSVIAIYGRDRNTVSIGRVSDIKKDEGGAVVQIGTDVKYIKQNLGSPIVNLSGDVVGVEKREDDVAFHSYVPISEIQKSIKTAVAELSK